MHILLLSLCWWYCNGLQNSSYCNGSRLLAALVFFIARWVSYFVKVLKWGWFVVSDGNLTPLLILFPKIIFSQASMSYILGNLLTFHPKFAILYSLHESHNFHEEFAFLLMVKMHTPFSAFSYESSEDLCSNNWRCVFRALQLGRTFSLYKFEKEM